MTQEEEIQMLRKTLEFYECIGNCTNEQAMAIYVVHDNGKMARDVLHHRIKVLPGDKK